MEEMRRVSLSMFTDEDLQRVHDYSNETSGRERCPYSQ